MESNPRPAPGKRTLGRMVMLVFLLAAAGVVLTVGPRQVLGEALAWAEDLGPAGPAVLAVIYVIATVCLAPGSLLTLAAGALFGLAWGFLAVTVGANLGAVLAFMVGRFLARDWVKGKMARYPKFAAVDQVVAEQGLAIVLLTRLSPLFPFNLLNFMFGATQVKFRDYALGTLIGMLPGTLLYVYLGSGLRDLAAVFSGRQERTAMEYVLLGAGLAATVVVTLLITQKAKKVLEGSLQPSGGTTSSNED